MKKLLTIVFLYFVSIGLMIGCGKEETQKEEQQETEQKEEQQENTEQEEEQQEWSITITDSNHNTDNLVIKNENTDKKLVNAIQEDFKLNNVDDSKYSIGEVSLSSDEPGTIYLAPMYPNLTEWNDVLVDNLTFFTRQALKEMGQRNVIVLVVDNSGVIFSTNFDL